MDDVPPLVPLDLPPEFAALPAEEQRRLLTAGVAMTQYVFRLYLRPLSHLPPAFAGSHTA
jgi:hypothetical protein